MIVDKIEIPNKSLFKAHEVCSLIKIKPYVLRFWESEFSQITPVVSSAGQKMYEHKDIQLLLQIRELLFDQKHTIEQAKGIIAKREDGVCEQSSDESGIVKSSSVNFSRSLTDSDIQKLVLAKAKLRSLINHANSLKQFNNWH